MLEGIINDLSVTLTIIHKISNEDTADQQKGGLSELIVEHLLYIAPHWFYLSNQSAWL